MDIPNSVLGMKRKIRWVSEWRPDLVFEDHDGKQTGRSETGKEILVAEMGSDNTKAEIVPRNPQHGAEHVGLGRYWTLRITVEKEDGRVGGMTFFAESIKDAIELGTLILGRLDIVLVGPPRIGATTGDCI